MTMPVDPTPILNDLTQVQTDFSTLFGALDIGPVAEQFTADVAQVVQDVQTATQIANNPPQPGSD